MDSLINHKNNIQRPLFVTPRLPAPFWWKFLEQDIGSQLHTQGLKFTFGFLELPKFQKGKPTAHYIYRATMKYDSHLAVAAIILLLTAGVFLGVGATNLSTRPLYSGPVCVGFGSLFLLASVLMCKYASKGPHPGPVVKIHRNPLRKVGQNIPHKQKSKTDPVANSQQDPSIKNWKNPAENTKERDKVEITRFYHTAV